MSLRIVVISGTFAPSVSHLYYRPLLSMALQHSEKVDFYTIPQLGLGGMKDALIQLEAKIFPCNEKLILIGHSQGGILASLIARIHSSETLAVVALAAPFGGTSMADPLNMPTRLRVELQSQLQGKSVGVRPSIRRVVIPGLPIVGDLVAHSQISDELCEYLRTTATGYVTHAIIGSHDMLVFPHRSANPPGKSVQSYIVVPHSEYQKLKHVLPPRIIPIYSSAGHISLVRNKAVLEQISGILADSY